MTFQKGWKLRRDAAHARAAATKAGSNEYRTWATRQREIEGAGRNLTALVERHGALLEEAKRLSKRIEVREYNAAAAGMHGADDDVNDDTTYRIRERLALLPGLIDAAAAAMKAERSRVADLRAAIVARHDAEDAAQRALVEQETAADAAAELAHAAIMSPAETAPITTTATRKATRR